MLTYASEKSTYADRDTGAQITRLTGWRANSNHLYFTNNSFFDGGKRIVLESDRGNAHNLFSLDLSSGEIEQLTDLPALPYPHNYSLLEGFVSAARAQCCFFAGSTLYCLDIHTRDLRPIFETPAGFRHHIVSISADGQYAYTSIYQNTAGRSLKDICLAHPLSRILRVALDGSRIETVWEEHEFIAHVNASPADPDWLTFCHEGPWDVVDHRLFSLHLPTGTVRKLHPCKPGEVIGHEYWYADGRRIGYHGSTDGAFQLGVIAADGSSDTSCAFPFHTGHIFSFDERLIVGDGDREGRYIRLWTKNADGYGAPRALCLHNCSFKRQRAHVHPRLTPDGRSVLYTSDETGYEQVYLARIPEDVRALPLLSTLSDY